MSHLLYPLEQLGWVVLRWARRLLHLHAVMVELLVAVGVAVFMVAIVVVVVVVIVVVVVGVVRLRLRLRLCVLGQMVEIDYLVAVVEPIVGFGATRRVRLVLCGFKSPRLEVVQRVGGQVVKVIVTKVKLVVGHGGSICQLGVPAAEPMPTLLPIPVPIPVPMTGSQVMSVGDSGGRDALFGVGG